MSAWFFRSPVGLVHVTGTDALELLHRLSTNELQSMPTPSVRETLLTNAQGRLIDWVTLVRLKDGLRVFTSPGRAASVVEWLEQFIIMEDCAADVDGRTWNRIRCVEVDGNLGVDLTSESDCVVTGGVIYTKPPSPMTHAIDVFVPVEEHSGVIDRIGELARELTSAEFELDRVRRGVPSPEYEYREPINPLELRLAKRAISFSKGCFVGQEVLARMDSYDKVARLLMGWSADVEFVPNDSARFMVESSKIGRVTSSFVTPQGRTVGLAMIERRFATRRLAHLVQGTERVAVQLDDRPFWTGRST